MFSSFPRHEMNELILITWYRAIYLPNPRLIGPGIHPPAPPTALSICQESRLDASKYSDLAFGLGQDAKTKITQKTKIYFNFQRDIFYLQDRRSISNRFLLVGDTTVFKNMERCENAAVELRREGNPPKPLGYSIGGYMELAHMSKNARKRSCVFGDVGENEQKQHCSFVSPGPESASSAAGCGLSATRAKPPEEACCEASGMPWGSVVLVPRVKEDSECGACMQEARYGEALALGLEDESWNCVD